MHGRQKSADHKMLRPITAIGRARRDRYDGEAEINEAATELFLATDRIPQDSARRIRQSASGRPSSRHSRTGAARIRAHEHTERRAGEEAGVNQIAEQSLAFPAVEVPHPLSLY